MNRPSVSPRQDPSPGTAVVGSPGDLELPARRLSEVLQDEALQKAKAAAKGEFRRNTRRKSPHRATGKPRGRPKRAGSRRAVAEATGRPRGSRLTPP